MSRNDRLRLARRALDSWLWSQAPGTLSSRVIQAVISKHRELLQETDPEPEGRRLPW